MNHQQKIFRLVLCVICFMFLILHSTWKFESTVSFITLENKREELKKTAELNSKAIQKKYANMLNTLTLLAENISNDHETDEEAVYKKIQFVADLKCFDYVGISDEYGNSLDSQHVRSNISDRSYFKTAMQGNVSISDVMPSKVIKNDDVQVMAVPIMIDDHPKGIVFGILNVKTVGESLENVSGNHIYTQLIDSEGNPLTRLKTDIWMSQHKNIWDYYQECKFLDGNVETLKQHISNHVSGYYTVRFHDETRVTYYTPLGLKDYYIFSNIDTVHFQDWLKDINKNAMFMTLEILAAFLVLALGTLWFNKAVSDELKTTYKSAVSNEEILKIAVSQSEKFIFEYDISKQQLHQKAGSNPLLFPDPIMTDVLESIRKNRYLKSESANQLIDIFKNIKNNQTLSAVVQTDYGQDSQWFQIMLKNLYDKKHRIINTVGFVENVTALKLQEQLMQKEKQMKIKLLERAERDGLTNLYNLSTARDKINEFLNVPENSQKQNAFILMDLDNFKSINDTFGHQYGNQVITEMANLLAGKFRHTDVIARLGGDEFLAFLFDIYNLEKIEQTLSDLVEQCEKTYEKDGLSVTISASFGVSLSPYHGTSFDELAQKADEMLYKVKRDQKKGYQIYPM